MVTYVEPWACSGWVSVSVLGDKAKAVPPSRPIGGNPHMKGGFPHLRVADRVRRSPGCVAKKHLLAGRPAFITGGRQTSLRVNCIFCVSWNQLTQELFKTGGGLVGKLP